MGRQTGNIFRTTISVPLDLKERMDAVTEQVNWSAIACRAFEDKLAEIASKKGKKTMNDVIQRLRASKQRMESKAYQEGEEAGKAWASDIAEAEELVNLRIFLEELDREPAYGRGFFFSEQPGNAFTNAELLFFAIHPEHDHDRDEATRFWEGALGDEAERAEDDTFLQGFAEGADAIWMEVREKL